MAIEEVSTWVPQACSLPTAERPSREVEFDRLFGDSAVRSTRVHKTRLDVELDAVAEDRARALAARESACCSFFTFGFDRSETNVVMLIEVPESQSAVLDLLTVRIDAVSGGDVR